MPEGSMPKVVPQCDGLSEILVEPQRPGNRPGYLAYLKGMREPRAVMILMRN